MHSDYKRLSRLHKSEQTVVVGFKDLSCVHLTLYINIAVHNCVNPCKKHIFIPDILNLYCYLYVYCYTIYLVFLSLLLNQGQF